MKKQEKVQEYLQENSTVYSVAKADENTSSPVERGLCTFGKTSGVNSSVLPERTISRQETS